MLIDTHCHLDFKDFDNDRDEVLARARKEGVNLIINVGSSVEGTRRSVELAQRYDFIYAAIGIHPHDADIVSDDWLDEFRGYCDKEKVVAVGEIGLDYYKNLSSKDNQKRLFLRLLELASEKNLPVIIHSRDAHKDMSLILDSVMKKGILGVMHCFSGEEIDLKRYLDMGMYISFTCNLTFKNAGRLRLLAEKVPLERLLLETDSPFLAPQPFRGSRNEPAYIRYLAEEIARIKNLSVEEVADITTKNACRLFGLAL